MLIVQSYRVMSREHISRIGTTIIVAEIDITST